MSGVNATEITTQTLLTEYAGLVGHGEPAACATHAGAVRVATGHFRTMGRIIGVSGAKCTVLLEGAFDAEGHVIDRAQMGALLAVETINGAVLAMVAGLSVPTPSQGKGDREQWIAELGFVGEIIELGGAPVRFVRGVTQYPSLGDRVRVARHHELELAFLGSSEDSVRVGSILQDKSIPAHIRVDELLAKHFAILGTTGTGKSCTTALVLRAILGQSPEAHILLLDPHGEYAAAFSDCAEVLDHRNMQLPYWLLTFDELCEVVFNGPDRRQEMEILQELIPLAKNRYGRSASQQGLRRQGADVRATLDTPVPYRMSELITMIDERMGRLDNKNEVQPHRNLKSRLESIIHDPRYAFMFGSLTVYDGMAKVLGRLFRVPVRGKPVTIVELTGLPAEITTVVVSVLCRLTFDFALWSEGRVPVTIVCEEAHRYVPADGTKVFEPCRRAIARIAKEGRKYGASLCVVTQRPAEIDPTILSQCNTVFALRLSNDRDQALVQSALSDTGSGLVQFLPSLGAREAIAFGDGVALPVRIKFDNLPVEHLPRSASASYSDRWKECTGDDAFLEALVDRWRASSSAVSDVGSDIGSLAAALPVPQFEPIPPKAPTPVEARMARSRETGIERRSYGALRRDRASLPAGAPPGASIQQDDR